MSDAINRTPYYKNSINFLFRVSTLRMFCNIKLPSVWHDYIDRGIAFGCIVTNIYIYIYIYIYVCVYVGEKYSISPGDSARLNRSATRIHWCALVNASPVQRPSRAPMPDECVDRVDTERECFQVHLRALKARADVSRKINYLLVWATLQRPAAFANELAPGACHNATRAGHVGNWTDSQPRRPPRRYLRGAYLRSYIIYLLIHPPTDCRSRWREARSAFDA